MRYFDDFQLGEVQTAGPYAVTQEEIVAFAKQFDPQPFHLDEAAAKATHFGGIVASGWHICAMGHRLLVEHVLCDTAALGSPGVDSVRWIRPVRPGDSLTLHTRLLTKTPSRSRPDRGTLRWEILLENAKGERVMQQRAACLFTRNAGSARQ